MIRYIAIFLFFISQLGLLQAECEVVFTNVTDVDTLNRELSDNFKRFGEYLIHSPYYVPSKNASLLTDFIVFLANKSGDAKIRRALDYLLKTGGPFGVYVKGEPEEEVLLVAVSQLLVESDPNLKNEDYNSIFPVKSRQGSSQERLRRVLEIQHQAVTENLPYPPLRQSSIRLSSGVECDSLPAPDIRIAWRLFKGLLVSPDLFNEPAYKSVTKDVSWLNDVELIGYQLGVLPDVRGAYIDDLWAKDNSWMETQHNYVQWWFPIKTVGMGDGVMAPRFLESTQVILGSNLSILVALQNMMRLSFARKARFWGHRAHYCSAGDLRLEKLSFLEEAEKWERNWIEKNHNYLRMTRFLTCLRLFKLIPERKGLFNYLKTVKDKHITNKNVSDSFETFWKPEYDQPVK